MRDPVRAMGETEEGTCVLCGMDFGYMDRWGIVGAPHGSNMGREYASRERSRATIDPVAPRRPSQPKTSFFGCRRRGRLPGIVRGYVVSPSPASICKHASCLKWQASPCLHSQPLFVSDHGILSISIAKADRCWHRCILTGETNIFCADVYIFCPCPVVVAAAEAAAAAVVQSIPEHQNNRPLFPGCSAATTRLRKVGN